MNKTILFEPWGLGDAVIAASIMRIEQDQYILACNSKWHDLLFAAGIPKKLMIAVDIAYATGQRKNFYDFNQLNSENFEKTMKDKNIEKVLSIRGDFRDRLVARRLFPKARLKFTGWKEFIFRRNRCLDLPFNSGLIKVRNRYEAWAQITGIPFTLIKNTYANMPRPDGNKICIHIGAQFKSKQYPFVRAIKDALAERNVEIIAGPNDPLPEGIVESDIKRLEGVNFVKALKQYNTVIVNDSGPMHMAAFLGCKTVVIARTSNIEEWIPPYVVKVCSPKMPKGYRPNKYYASNTIMTDWPSVEKILEALSDERRYSWI